MPDPHKALAPIIEPTPPPVLASGTESLLPDIFAVAGVILVLALAGWLWRRWAPQRALLKLARQPDALLAADQLAAWVRARGVTPSVDWQRDLERLRFGPPAADATKTLTRLCLAATRLR